MLRRTYLLRTFTAAVLAISGVIAGAQVASAHPGHEDPVPTKGASSGSPTPNSPEYFVAKLKGTNEVPVANGPATGDRDASGTAIIRIEGKTISFTLNWNKTSPLTLGHIHEGVSGVNGPVKVPLFAGTLPGTLNTVTGNSSVEDANLIKAIETDPAKYYVNLHSTQFPGGAVRGQLEKSRKPLDLTRFLRGSLVAVADGRQEVPTLGDTDGQATGFLRAHRGKLDFAVTWNGIGAPTLGHVHPGTVGQAGAPVVTLFSSEAGLPGNITGVAGTVSSTVRFKDPASFYLNLHTKEFPTGAVRGQLFDPRER